MTPRLVQETPSGEVKTVLLFAAVVPKATNWLPPKATANKPFVPGETWLVQTRPSGEVKSSRPTETATN